MLHPEVAWRDCGDCQQFLYEESGQRKERMGRPVPWPKGMGPDCRLCPKCKGSESPGPEAGRKAALSRRNLACLDAFWERPADPDATARRNFGIIRRLLRNERGTVGRLGGLQLSFQPGYFRLGVACRGDGHLAVLDRCVQCVYGRLLRFRRRLADFRQFGPRRFRCLFRDLRGIVLLL